MAVCYGKRWIQRLLFYGFTHRSDFIFIRVEISEHKNHSRDTEEYALLVGEVYNLRFLENLIVTTKLAAEFSPSKLLAWQEFDPEKQPRHRPANRPV